MQCLKILCFPSFSVGISCKTALQFKYHHIFGFMVVRGLTNIYLVGGLGVEDHPNSLREVPILPLRFLWGWTKGKVYRSKSRTLDEMEQKIRDTLAAFFFLFLKEIF